MLIRWTDSRSLSMARTQGPGAPNGSPYPTSRGVRRQSWLSHWTGTDNRQERRRGVAYLSYVPVPSCRPPLSDSMYRSVINQRMGRPELGRDSRTHQRPNKAHCWAYQKPTCHDTRLHLKAIYASTLSRQCDYASVADFARVSTKYWLCT